MLRGLRTSRLWVSSAVFWLLKTLHSSAPNAQKHESGCDLTKLCPNSFLSQSLRCEIPESFKHPFLLSCANAWLSQISSSSSQQTTFLCLLQLLFYSNPFFTRDDPPCIRRGVQGAVESTNPLDVLPPGTEILAKLPSKRWDAQPAAGSEEEDDDMQTSMRSSCTVPEARAGPRAGRAGPSPCKRPCRHSPAASQHPAPAPAASPLPRATPPAPHRPLALEALPTPRSGQPNPGAAQVPGAALPPPCPLWFGVATLGSGPVAGHAPAHGHCPTCSCTANAARPRPQLDWEEQGP